MGLNITDRISSPTGTIVVTKRDNYGNIISQEIFHNAIMNSGKNLILNRLINNTEIDPVTYVALGIGSGVANSGDVALELEVARTTVVITKSTISSLEVKFSAYFDSNNPGTSNYDISEVAIFGGAATATADTGTMVARALLDSAQNKVVGQHSLTIDYKLSM